LLVDLIVFDGVDELDVIGPLEVFRRAAAVGAEVAVRICSREHVEWVSGAFGVNFKPDATFVPGAADVVVVPGGGWVAKDEIGAWAEVKRGDWLPLLAEAARDGSVMAGVCTGAMLLAHAGVIGTRRATTHHDAQGDLALLGAVVMAERVVDEGSVVTSGGGDERDRPGPLARLALLRGKPGRGGCRRARVPMGPLARGRALPCVTVPSPAWPCAR
jgi:putative intracellular protease/amidase